MESRLRGSGAAPRWTGGPVSLRPPQTPGPEARCDSWGLWTLLRDSYRSRSGVSLTSRGVGGGAVCGREGGAFPSLERVRRKKDDSGVHLE